MRLKVDLSVIVAKMSKKEVMQTPSVSFLKKSINLFFFVRSGS